MSAVGEDHKRLLGDIELLDGLGAEAPESLAQKVRWVESPARSELIAEGGRHALTTADEIGKGGVAEEARDLLGSI